MKYGEKTAQWETFFRESQKDELTRVEAEGERAIIIPFNDIAKQHPDLADALLDAPYETLDAAEDALEKLSFLDSVPKPRVVDLPDSETVPIRNLRSHHIDKFIAIKGLVKRASEVRPELESAVFECTNCGDRYEKEQDGTKIKTPYKCDCGNRNFDLVDKNMIDVQIVTIEEDPERIEGAEQPRKIGCYLRRDLVDPEFQNNVIPGNKVELTGVLKEQPQDNEEKRYDLYIEGNYLNPVQREFEEIDIDQEEEEEIKELSNQDNVFDQIVDSIAPSIHGHRQVKKAIALQLFSGNRKERPDGTSTRGDIHVLLIGEPGTGKSQLLKYTGNLAPKGKYVVGKSATAAGITATAMKDEITDGWVLEAGALVLANKGLATIDEIDKMSDEDRSSMHEAMEQQCFAPDTRVMLPDGTTDDISSIVDEQIDNETPDEKVTAEAEDIRVMSTDFTDSFTTRPEDVSVVGKRPVPDEIIRLELETGRTLELTPEHPVFQIRDGEPTDIEAGDLEAGMLFPAPPHLPVQGETQTFDDITHEPAEKSIETPATNGTTLSTFVGYHLSDGGYELNRGTKAGVNFTNTNEKLIEDYISTVEDLFDIDPYVRNRDNRKEVRVISKELVNWWNTLENSFIAGGPEKKIPERLMKCKKEDLAPLVRAFFDGDGGVYTTDRGYRLRAVGENRMLMEQLQEILLRFGIHSRIYEDGNVHRIEVARYEDMKVFNEQIGFLSEQKQERLDTATATARDSKNPVPGLSSTLMELMQTFGVIQDDLLRTNLCSGDVISKKRADTILSALEEKLEESKEETVEGGYERLKDTRKKYKISCADLSRHLDVNARTVHHWETNKTGDIEAYRDALQTELDCIRGHESTVTMLRNLIENIDWLRIRDVSRITPEYDYVYDLTVPGTNSFIAENTIAHNSITVSKANIQATLQCRTSILAAGNPKFGRFDPYKPVGEQIDISDTLLSRFDLLFPVKDIPDRSKDRKLSEHIISMHTNPEEHTGIIEQEQLRNYIAYAKRHSKPALSEGAQEQLKDFYVNTREQGGSGEDGLSKVPITARQLEALIRLAEASAKTRLSDTVEEKDAERAIDLLTYSLKQIGVIDESGEFDIDKLETGMSSEDRSRMQIIMGIISDLGGDSGDAVPIEDVLAQCEEEGLTEDEAEEIINELKRDGEIYEPKNGHIGTI